jgi:hypothetical protein
LLIFARFASSPRQRRSFAALDSMAMGLPAPSHLPLK